MAPGVVRDAEVIRAFQELNRQASGMALVGGGKGARAGGGGAGAGAGGMGMVKDELENK